MAAQQSLARIWPATALMAGLAAGGADAAQAKSASPLVRLQIAAEPVRTALIDFALQTDLSLGGDLEACQGQAPALSGRMSVQAALARILAHSGCGYTLPDARTVLIRKAPPPRRAPPRPQDAPPALALGEIVITAQRYPNLPGRTPYGISVIAGDALARETLTSLGDLSGQVAGMTVTNLGPGRDKILLRGLSDGAFTGQTQSMVALYLDDVPITYSAPDPDLRLADIERVEVMRGPQGTLYGGGSLGGVVRIATRKPDFDRYEASVLAGVSRTWGGGDGGELEAMANIPLVPGRVALRAVAYRETQGGYIADPALGLSRVNSSRRDGGRAALRVAVSPNWTAVLNLTHQSINNNDTQYGLSRLGPRQRDNLVREPHDNDFDRVSLTLTGEGAWGRVTGSAARLAHRFHSRYDATTAAALFELPAGPAVLDEAKRIDLTIAEVTYTTPTDHRLHGLVGVFASTGEIRLNTALGAFPATGVDAYAERRSDKINETAVYGEVTLDLSKQLSATAGLRWFDFRFDTNSDVVQADGERRFAGADDAKGLSPKVLVSYVARSDVLIYAQAAEGYRPGGFNTSGRIGQTYDTVGAPPKRYEADELWNYEVGAKMRWLDDRLQARVAAFYATWQSVQSDQYLPDGTAFTANIGDGDNRGLETEAALRLSDRIDLTAAALINDPRITRRNLNFSSRSDAGLPGVSRASASLAIDYHRRLPGDRLLRLQGQAAYVGASYLTFEPNETQEMGDYVSLRGVATIETPAWTLSATIDNPFQDQANTFSFGNPFLITRDQVVTPLRPRTVALRLSARF